MEFYPGEFYHIYNRGNIHQRIFFENKNYFFFLKKMESHLLPYCDLLAWCLMPNHFHWLIKVKELDDLRPDLNSDHPSKSNSVINRALEKKGLKSDVKNEKITNQVTELNESIGILLRSYTRAINRAFAFKGSLFQQGTKAKNVNPEISMRDNYALVCFLYIHQNPIRAGLVNHFEDWHFSSFRDYAGFRNGKLCNQSLAKQLLFLPETVDDFIRFSNQTLPENYQYKIF